MERWEGIMSQAVRDEDFISGVITRRVLAWVIDVAMISVILGVLWVILFMFGLLTLGLGFGAMAVLPAVPFLYHFLSLLRPSSATPGQSILGITVRRDEDLGPPTGIQALIFTVVFYLTMATSGLLLLITPFTVRHRTLHDLASDLVVVRRSTLAAWIRQMGANGPGANGPGTNGPGTNRPGTNRPGTNRPGAGWSV
jgi:uncharacterized RDD family membrane protein YckC